MCVLHLAPVQAQCTRRHYGDDDDNNNNENFLVAMMGHLRDTVDQLRLDHDRSTNQLQQQFNHTTENLRQEQQRSTKQLQQQLNHTVEQLRQEQQRSTKQLQQQFNHTADQLRQDQQSSTEQLRQLFNHAMVDQQKQLTSIEKRLTTVCMYYLMLVPDKNNNDNIPDVSVAPILININVFNKHSVKHRHQIIKVNVSKAQ